MQIIPIITAMMLLFGCISNEKLEKKDYDNNSILDNNVGVDNMKITSVFKHGDLIPSKYTCDGQDISPALKISDAPKNAKSLVLIVDDPDAPMGVWLHWTLWNIPPGTNEIAEGAKIGVEGITDFRKPGYGGPCPPNGQHTYRFKLYALDIMLNLKQGATLAQLGQAIKGHILAQAELDGEYSRQR